MARVQFGPRLIDAVVPRFWPDVQQMHLDTKLAYSTLHAWKKGRQQPHLDVVVQIADFKGVDPLELLGGSLDTLGNDPGWIDAVSKARALTVLPDWVLARVARFPTWLPRGMVTARLVADLADAVFRNTPDHVAVSAAELPSPVAIVRRAKR